MTRGEIVCRARKAFLKKRLAACALRVGLSMKSMNSTLFPSESTAR